MKKPPILSTLSLNVHSTREFHFYRKIHDQNKTIINLRIRSKKQYNLTDCRIPTFHKLPQT